MRTIKAKFSTLILLLIFLIITTALISMNLGVINISPIDVLNTFLGNGTDKQELVLFKFRLPGIILAILIGAGLAVSGAILQAITHNELAEPGILGINSGAGLAIVLFIYFLQNSGIENTSAYMMPLFALIGALLSAALIYALSWKGGVNPIRMLLVGIGVNAGFNAALIIFQLRMDPQDFRQATVWIAGDIWSANWGFVYALLPWVLILIPIILIKASSLNLLNLSEDVATSLGTKVEPERLLLLFLAVTLAGACVAAGGGIAFLGLVAPHIARRIIGPLHQYLIPITALIGALLILLADTIGNNILSPTQIPVGIVVAILSTPYFVFLLIKAK